MKYNLEDVHNCHVCGSVNLVPRYKVPIPDMFTEEEILRSCLQCDECDTLHYIDNGVISYEFSVKLNDQIRKEVSR
jgi:hypothetical protein